MQNREIYRRKSQGRTVEIFSINFGRYSGFLPSSDGRFPILALQRLCVHVARAPLLHDFNAYEDNIVSWRICLNLSHIRYVCEFKNSIMLFRIAAEIEFFVWQ
jgi:hypothetical protein